MAGVTAQRYLGQQGEAIYQSSDVWQGRTSEMVLEQSDAQEKLEEVVGWLNYDWDGYHSNVEPYGVQYEGMPPFWEDDLKNLRRKILHAQSDAGEDDKVSFEVTDRERLLIFDLTFGGPDIAEVRQLGREELSWNTSD